MRDQIILIYGYLLGIWRYRWMSLVIASFVALAGWMVVLSLPSQYTSNAIMHVDTKSVMKPLLKGLSVESDSDDAGINIMSRVLRSRKNLEEVIRQTDMDHMASSSQALDRLVTKLGESVELKRSGKGRGGSNIYELSYQGESPELVYQVVSKLLNTLIENTLDSARTDTASAQKFLDNQINEYEIRLTHAEQELAQFKRANVGFMPDERGGYYNRLRSEETKLNGLRSKLALERRRYSAMLKQLEGEAPLLGSNAYGQSRVAKLRQYRRDLELLLTQYKEQHPDVVALRATIAEIVDGSYVAEVSYGNIDSQEFNPIYQELKAESHKVNVEIETIKLQLGEQEKKVFKLKQSVDVLPGVEASLAKLNRDYDITRERYLNLVTRRESARLAQAVGQSGSNIKFRIIDPPRVPTKPSGPKRLLLLSGVFIFAIMSGLGFGLLRYLIHPTYIDTRQVRNKIDLPVLGAVGLYMDVKKKRLRTLQLTGFVMAFSLLVVSYGVVMVFNGQGSMLVNELLTSQDVMI